MSCTPQEPVTTWRKRGPPRLYQPGEDSLYDILYQHAGQSLFVQPIFWNNLHLRLFGVRWEELPRCGTPQPGASPSAPPSRGHLNPSQTITTLSNSLTQILKPDEIDPTLSSNAIETILKTLWPTAFNKPHHLSKLHLYFGGRVYRDAVYVQIMWNGFVDETGSSSSSPRSVPRRPTESSNVSTQSPSNQSPAKLPTICYISKAHLASVREDLFYVAPHPKRPQNEPVLRLKKLRVRKVVPSNSDHDAYFVGIFLAMARKHFYPPPTNTDKRESRMTPKQGIPLFPDVGDLKLRILTHDIDKSEFIVYTGYETRRFLEKFHYPLKAPRHHDNAALSGLKIEYTRVPIWPILGLKGRLGKALGQDVVGAFNPNEMVTWERDPVEMGGEKRKADDLPEVIDLTDDEAGSTRRLKKCKFQEAPEVIDLTSDETDEEESSRA